MVAAIVDILIFSLIITAKTAFVTWQANDQTSLPMVCATTFVSIMMLFSFLISVRRNTRIFIMLAVDFFLSALLLADALFFRYNQNIITLPMLDQIGQVGIVSSSISQLFRQSDWFLFVDLLLLIPVFIKWRAGFAVSVVPARKAPFIATCVILFSVTVWQGFSYVSRNYDKESVLHIYSNGLVLRNFGILYYHLADLILHNRILPVTLEDITQWRLQHKQPLAGNLSGIGKGKSLIVLQVEALQEFVIGSSIDGQEITPNINALAARSIYFDNYFSQIADGNTSDAEFMSLTSLYPLQVGSAFIKKSGNTYKSLPIALKELEYKSYAFHAFNPDYYNRDKVFVSLGFDKFFSNKEYRIPYETVVGLGLSDKQMLKQTFDKIRSLPRPSFFFVITLTAHHPYSIPENLKKLRIPPGEYSPVFEEYLQVQHYADEQIGIFLDNLRLSGILDDSILALYGDHFAPGLEPGEIYKITGRSGNPDIYQSAELLKVPLIVRLPFDAHKGECHTTGGQIDFFPTLANIMGLDYRKLLFFGNDLLNTGRGFAAFRRYIPPGSFVDDELFYIASDDGMFYSGTCYSRMGGRLVNNGHCFAGYKKMKHEIDMSDFILQNNNLSSILPF